MTMAQRAMAEFSINIAVVSLNEPPSLPHNENHGKGNWFIVRLEGVRSRLDFSLGEATHADRIEIRWLAGTRQVFEGVPANLVVPIHEPERAR